MSFMEPFEELSYYKGAAELTRFEKVIYVEGNNKFFYQSFSEISKYLIIGNFNCMDIIEMVKLYDNAHGIVDLDFTMNCSIDRIYPINYYSIENITLLYDYRYYDIVDKLNELINIYSIETVRQHKYVFQITRNEERYPSSFDIILHSKKHHEQFSEYINTNIICKSSFLRFMDLKSIVEKSSRYLREKGHLEKIDYIDNLFEKIPRPKFEKLFGQENLIRISEDLSI